jgi:diaminopimelate epimerase
MKGIEFIKMHGLGNDFVVIDDRARAARIGEREARAIGHRRTGVGFDQLLIMEPPTNDGADVFMRIRNPDGSEAQACGNGTRCVASKVMDELGQDSATVQTVAGLLTTRRNGDDLVSVNMGPANLDWQDIPLAEEMDTLNVDMSEGPLSNGVGVNMGNPHIVFFVDNAEAIDLPIVGPVLEHHSLLPERANIEVVHLIRPDHLRMRVWERSAGITMACGSGACAAAVAAHRRGLTGRNVRVNLDGGTLEIEWLDDNTVLMTGPVAISYRGFLDPALLAGAE